MLKIWLLIAKCWDWCIYIWPNLGYRNKKSLLNEANIKVVSCCILLYCTWGSCILCRTAFVSLAWQIIFHSSFEFSDVEYKRNAPSVFESSSDFAHMINHYYIFLCWKTSPILFKTNHWQKMDDQNCSLCILHSQMMNKESSNKKISIWQKALFDTSMRMYFSTND